jgi:hypothetical protein
MGLGIRSRRVLLAATLVACSCGLLVEAAPASATPLYQGALVFSGGPATFPNTGSVNSSVCVADGISCSVSLSITAGGALTASGTGTIVDGTETISFTWQSNPSSDGSFPENLLPAGGIVGSGTDQTGEPWFVKGLLARGATGGTVGIMNSGPTALCNPARTGDPVCDTYNQVVAPVTVRASADANAAGLITDYLAKGTASGNQFSVFTWWSSTTFCKGVQTCSLSLNGTGSVPGTTDNPPTYTASGTGTLNYGSETVNFSFQLSTALCNPDGLILTLGLGDESTCGYLSGSGTTTAGLPVNLAGKIQVGGFGVSASAVYPFPTIEGSLAIVGTG